MLTFGFLVVVVVVVAAQEAPCNTTDEAQLAVLQAMARSGAVNAPGWLASNVSLETICQAELGGVFCVNESGWRVLSLELRRFAGQLPPSLGDLCWLRMLAFFNATDVRPCSCRGSRR